MNPVSNSHNQQCFKSPWPPVAPAAGSAALKPIPEHAPPPLPYAPPRVHIPSPLRPIGYSPATTLFLNAEGYPCKILIQTVEYQLFPKYRNARPIHQEDRVSTVIFITTAYQPFGMLVNDVEYYYHSPVVLPGPVLQPPAEYEVKQSHAMPSIGAQENPSVKISRLLMITNQCQRVGLYHLALSALSDILNIFPNHPRALSKTIDIHLAPYPPDYSSAMQLAKQIMDKFPGHGIGEFLMSKVYVAQFMLTPVPTQNVLDKAQGHIRAADFFQVPTDLNASLLHLRGIIQYATFDLNGSARTLSSIPIHHQDFNTRFQLGVIAFEQSKFAFSTQIFAQLLRDEPRHDVLKAYLELICQKCKDPQVREAASAACKEYQYRFKKQKNGIDRAIDRKVGVLMAEHMYQQGNYAIAKERLDKLDIAFFERSHIEDLLRIKLELRLSRKTVQVALQAFSYLKGTEGYARALSALAKDIESEGDHKTAEAILAAIPR